MAATDTPTSIGLESITLTAQNAVAYSESPYTYAQQVYSYGNERWLASVTIPGVNRGVAEPWVAFLLSLRGPVGTFTLGDPLGATPAGAAKDYSDTITTSATASAGDTSLSLTGATVSITDYLKAGDYIQVGSGDSRTLHKVLSDVTSGAAGELAIVNMFPALRADVASGTSVSLFNTKGIFRLRRAVSSWTIQNADVYGISFEAIEVV